MAVKFKYRAHVGDNGKLEKVFGSRGFNQDLAMFSGKDIFIEIGKWTKSRSTKQNAYYHKIVINYVLEGLVEAGYERYKLNSEVVHEFLKDKFLKEEIASTDTGEVLNITRSTGDLSTTEFMDYIANIQTWSQEFLNIYIPNPGDQGEINF